MLTLALPALAVVLSDPMQSLIDSACVGRSSTIHLAALGPNTTIFNAAFQLFSFLGVATANTIASNSLSLPGLTQADLAARRDTAETALCNSVFLATLLGIGVAGVLRWQGAAWLGAMGTDPRVLPIAVDYLLVRALASPAVLVMNACQGACLGQQDTLTPMWVCLGATAFNLVGDIYLIWGAGMGVVGAALATAVAQALASLYFLARLLHGDGRKEAGGRGDLRLRWTVRLTFGKSVCWEPQFPLKHFKLRPSFFNLHAAESLNPFQLENNFKLYKISSKIYPPWLHCSLVSRT